MSLIIPANTLASGGFAVDNSCRFNNGSSDYLNRSVGGNSTLNTKGTWSTWIKKANTTDAQNTLFSGYADANNRVYSVLNSNKLVIFGKVGGTGTYSIELDMYFRDFSAWYNVVVAVDTTQGTASDRIKYYINGTTPVASLLGTSVYPVQDSAIPYAATSSYNNLVGAAYTTSITQYLSGYLAETVFIDGLALDATSFGEFNSQTGIWVPKVVTGLTFGDNGFYQNYSNASALGEDFSGNDNDFTVNNLTSIDQSTDTCSTNFATFNALTKNTARGTLSNGNLTYVATDSNWSAIPSSIGVSSGKWYAEFKFSSSVGNDLNVGIIDEASLYNVISSGTGASDFYIGKTSGSYGYFANGNKVNNASSTAYGASYTNGDIVGVALDMDAGTIVFYKNGASQGTAFTGLSGTYFIGLSTYKTGEANFGSPSFAISSGNTDQNGFGNFEYAPPAGYLSLNTKNLAAVLA